VITDALEFNHSCPRLQYVAFTYAVKRHPGHMGEDASRAVQGAQKMEIRTALLLGKDKTPAMHAAEAMSFAVITA
jgi:hypothetical protein